MSVTAKQLTMPETRARYVLLTPMSASASIHIVCKPKAIDSQKRWSQLDHMKRYLTRGGAIYITDCKDCSTGLPFLTASIADIKSILDTVRRASGRYGVFFSTNNPTRYSSDKRYETECREWDAKQQQQKKGANDA